MATEPEFTNYGAPAGGWGSLQSVGRSLAHNHVPVKAPNALLKQNKVDGFSCVSCAWAKPAHPHAFEFCEEGTKATAWELTSKRCTPEFFANHTVTSLEAWDDHQKTSAG